MKPSFKKSILAILVISALAWLLFGWFGVQALFTNKKVKEAVPLATMDSLTQEPVQDKVDTASPKPMETQKQEASPTSETNPAPAVPRLLAQGSFAQGDSTYNIKGTATVTEQNGVRTLSFTDFNVTNGPDLFVYLVSAPSLDNSIVKNAVSVGSFVNLGELKGNQGNQNYIIPPDVVLSGTSVVSIWCRRFSRNFGVANISAQK